MRAAASLRVRDAVLGRPPAAGPPSAARRALHPRPITRRGPRGGAACSAPRHVREGLGTPAGPSARSPSPRPRDHPRVPAPGAPQGALGQHPGGARSPTLPHGVLHHAPRRAFSEPKWTPWRRQPHGHRPRTPPSALPAPTRRMPGLPARAPRPSPRRRGQPPKVTRTRAAAPAPAEDGDSPGRRVAGCRQDRGWTDGRSTKARRD